MGGSHDGALRVSVTAPADKGKANKAIAKAIAEALQLKPSQIELISGQTNRRKVYKISDAASDLESRIAELQQ